MTETVERNWASWWQKNKYCVAALNGRWSFLHGTFCPLHPCDRCFFHVCGCLATNCHANYRHVSPDCLDFEAPLSGIVNDSYLFEFVCILNIILSCLYLVLSISVLGQPELADEILQLNRKLVHHLKGQTRFLILSRVPRLRDSRLITSRSQRNYKRSAKAHELRVLTILPHRLACNCKASVLLTCLWPTWIG